MPPRPQTELRARRLIAEMSISSFCLGARTGVAGVRGPTRRKTWRTQRLVGVIEFLARFAASRRRLRVDLGFTVAFGLPLNEQETFCSQMLQKTIPASSHHPLTLALSPKPFAATTTKDGESLARMIRGSGDKKCREPHARAVGTKQHERSAAILVWFALLLPLLLGMTGLVIDAGLLMASHRHLQNSVDAAALAGANNLVKGRAISEAKSTATEYVTVHHELSTATVEVHSPPVNGPYAGEQGFVEVIAEYETPTIFMQLLNGVHQTGVARARAVAGSELVELIDGIIALDPRARSGLTVTGNAQFNVTGRVIVNSEGGGLDAEGTPIGNGQGGFAAFVSPFALAKATEVHVVGGVNRVDRFQNYEAGGPPPLKTGQLPVPDPLIYLPIPTVGNGVVNVRRGAPQASQGQLVLNNPHDDPNLPNQIVTDQVTGEQTMILNPGVYSSIDITGGKVRFRPGIYVVAAPRESTYSVRIMDGEIEAQGIMFYNTKEGYDPISGQPDAADGKFLPPPNGENKGQIRINAALGFSAIDTLKFSYSNASPLISQFNGMLIYQRRRNSATIQLQGFAREQMLEGAIYAKWAKAQLPAGGVFGSQFVVGSLKVPGHGDLTIKYDNQDLVQSRQVFLVE